MLKYSKIAVCTMYVPLFFFAVTLAQKAPAYWQHFFRNKICTFLDNPDKIQKNTPQYKLVGTYI